MDRNLKDFYPLRGRQGISKLSYVKDLMDRNLKDFYPLSTGQDKTSF
jgi:hypothetical protein